MPCFFSKAIKEWSIMKNLRTSHWTFWKNAERDVFGFVIVDHFLTALKKKHGFYFFGIFEAWEQFKVSESIMTLFVEQP